MVPTLEGRLDQFDGLFTPNTTTSRAALAAMRRLQKAGQRVHIGFDGDDVLLDALAWAISMRCLSSNRGLSAMSRSSRHIRLARRSMRGLPRGESVWR